MKRLYLYKNMYIIFIMDLMIFACTWYGAYLIRFDFDLPQIRIQSALRLMPLVLSVKIGLFIFFRLYRGMWRYTSIADLLNIIKASLLSFLILTVTVLLWNRFENVPRSVFIIDFALTILFASSLRLGIRMFFTEFGAEKNIIGIIKHGLRILGPKQTDVTKLLLLGAGNCGEKIFRELKDNPSLNCHVVGFLDDKPSKKGLRIHGVSVLGTINELSVVAENTSANEVLITIPSASATQMRRIVACCQESSLPFKTVPGYSEILSRKVSFKHAREVAYRDLIGRDIIELEEEKIGNCIRGRAIMVTGAGGSIGSELCRQICSFSPSHLILFERAESPLYDIEMELTKRFQYIQVTAYLGDIQNKSDIDIVLKKYNPTMIFHAAAYKHVPMMENFPWKAVLNNIVGTSNLVSSAVEHNIQRFVMVSTDKAVRPTNVMGASKKIAEMVVQNYSCNAEGTKFMTVRFGNVIGSVGSVIPLFKKQITQGGPVTVTHPDITRFFMMIPEACQLILQAGAMGRGGEIYILDMGEPIKIDDMARDLIRFSGFEPDKDIQIEYIGLRPGEKLYEELIAQGEETIATAHKKIMVLNANDCSMDLLSGHIRRLKKASEEQDKISILEILKETVPEYTPSAHGAAN